MTRKWPELFRGRAKRYILHTSRGDAICVTSSPQRHGELINEGLRLYAEFPVPNDSQRLSIGHGACRYLDYDLYGIK